MPKLINPNWQRWIWASWTKHCEVNKDDVFLFYEGEDRDTEKREQFAEVRMDGPRVRKRSGNYFTLDVYFNLLVQTHLTHDDAYNHQRMMGAVTALFHECIPVYKYGTGVDDDQSLLGNLSLQYGRDEDLIKVANFGQIDETLRLQQATVEGHYKMEL